MAGRLARPGQHTTTLIMKRLRENLKDGLDQKRGESDGHFNLCFGSLTHLPSNMARKPLKRLRVMPPLPLHDQLRPLALARITHALLDPYVRDE